ncbi:MAG: FkbM family methyltransferase [Candidatus Omnitrophota bacterium]|jgi:FkbM family methyltransferase|nr:MAG: FkbM family methyltransferase [Candidatus Omnitrophota bacterium]
MNKINRDGTPRVLGNLSYRVFKKINKLRINLLKERARYCKKHAAGNIKLGNYRIDYLDFKSLVSQWDYIFGYEKYFFESNNISPRVLDCGANIGIFSLYCKMLYPGARITAIEADPKITEVLRKNLSVNGFDDIEVLNKAVWVKDGRVEFCEEGSDAGSLYSVVMDDSMPKINIDSMRLSDILAAQKIDLLKLDIEGAERDVLYDCSDHLSNVDKIIIDLHEFSLPQKNTADVISLLRQKDFVCNIDDIYYYHERFARYRVNNPFYKPAIPCYCFAVRAWRMR